MAVVATSYGGRLFLFEFFVEFDVVLNLTSTALALARVFNRRKQLAEKIHEKSKENDWGSPITP